MHPQTLENLSSAPALIIEFLRSQGGSARVADVMAHATAAGHSSATVRRAADAIVTKSRDGNTFTWSIDLDTVDEAPAESGLERFGGIFLWTKEKCLAECERLGIDLSWCHDGPTHIELLLTLEAHTEGRLIPRPSRARHF